MNESKITKVVGYCRLSRDEDKENYPEVLKKIVTKQVELNNNVC